MTLYPFREIDQKWQSIWRQNRCFEVNQTTSRPKAYILAMLPYPSGRLHMGHVRNYAISDAIARFMRASGFIVLHPMGWDAFGMPAENAAVSHNISPATWTYQNISSMKKELNALGFGYDWQREVTTCDPAYYGLEQKIFLDFYQKGLIYRKESWVNWDPIDQSVLANEQVIEGRGWRSNALVERRKLVQWFARITAYAPELLAGLSKLIGWPEKVRRMQEKWIGYSQGALIHFSVKETGEILEIFTTRPETVFGAAFCAISPEHPLAGRLAQNTPPLANFIQDCLHTITTEETLNTAEKIGFDTGLTVEHPFIPAQHLPIYVVNFVLMSYGTGAIFGCPAHDLRDFEFARKYGLPIRPVIQAPKDESFGQKAYMGPGTLINSDFLNGLTIETARKHIIQKLEESSKGKTHAIYRLRDWCISRQRYWGCPIPIIHCEDCGVVPVPEHDLPVELPVEVTFDQGGNSLDRHPTWKHVLCPLCKKPATRETDTLDTFFESSWYFFRNCSPQAAMPIDKKACETWMPVDWYIGGIEHAVLHLLYARFFTKASRDEGYLKLDEPFKNLLTQGMVCHQTFRDKEGRWLYPYEVTKTDDGRYITLSNQGAVTVGRSEKMSKSKKNLVDPQEIIEAYGSDATRLFMLSDTPPERDLEWSMEGIEGSWRYINRLWRLIHDIITNLNLSFPSLPSFITQPSKAAQNFRKTIHQFINKLTYAYQTNALHKAVAFARELTHILEEALHHPDIDREILKEGTEVLIKTLAPLIPHVTSELWQRLGHIDLLIDTPWPKADTELATIEQVTIAVQVNGKMRGSFEAPVGETNIKLEEQARRITAVQRDLQGKKTKRIIIVPNRIINFVV